MDLNILATNVAGSYGIPANIFGGMIGKESSWNVGAMNTNSNGTIDYGLGQINSKTAANMGLDTGRLLTDAQYNLDAAAQVLSQNYKSAGSWAGALSMYNTGSATSIKGTLYASDVLRRAGTIDENGFPTGKPGLGAMTDAAAGGKAFALSDSSTWLASIWEAIKRYLAPLGFVLLALFLIAVGLWKAVK